MSSEGSSSRGGGVSLLGVIGAVLAAYCSWSIWQSPFWCAIHALFGWLYLLYLCMGCGGGLPADFW